MLPRRARLSRADFAALASDRTAKRASTAHFSGVYSTNGAAKGCAVVISKKVERGSVRRHLLKRRMLAILRPIAVSDSALIVYAREGSGALSFPELAHELESLVSRLSPTALFTNSLA